MDLAGLETLVAPKERKVKPRQVFNKKPRLEEVQAAGVVLQGIGFVLFLKSILPF